MHRSRSLLALALVLTACQAAPQTDLEATLIASPTVAPALLNQMLSTWEWTE